MSLQITTSIDIQGRNLILFYEDTPDYNAVSQLYGWGTPNPLRSDIYTADATLNPAALLTLSEPDGVETTIDVTTCTPPLYIIGNNAAYNPLVLTKQFFGFSTGIKFIDGLNSLELNVQGLYGFVDPQLAFSSQATVQFYFIENVRCCVSNLLLAAQGCGCNDAKSVRALEAKAWLDVIEAGIACTNPNYTEIDCNLAVLQEICARSEGDCGCGC